MKEGEISVGSAVRYPRTGSSGVVEEITEIDGVSFAGVDSTGLYYQTKELILVELPPVRKKYKDETADEKDKLEQFKNRKILSSEDIEEAFGGVDGVGAG